MQWPLNTRFEAANHQIHTNPAIQWHMREICGLGPHPVLLLRNHGVLVAGPAIAEAFETLWLYQRACDIQLASDGMAGPNQPIPDAVLDSIHAQAAHMRPVGIARGELLFHGLLRRAGIRARTLG